MQADINEPKSRAFTIYLRFFHVGLALLIGVLVCNADTTGCVTSFYNMAIVLCLALIGINFIALVYLRCKDRFPKIQFFITFGIDLILVAILLITSFAGLAEVIIISIMMLFLSFYWVQRYTNAPGNFTWVVMFLGFSWTLAFNSKMIAIGVLHLLICFLTILANGIAAAKGITTGVKKIIVGEWVLALLIMVITQIIAIATYFQNSDSTDFNDQIAKKLLQIFIAVNVLDLLFWLFGLLTLNYENGDKIRDALLTFGHNPQLEEQGNNMNQEPQYENRGGYGTIK